MRVDEPPGGLMRGPRTRTGQAARVLHPDARAPESILRGQKVLPTALLLGEEKPALPSRWVMRVQGQTTGCGAPAQRITAGNCVPGCSRVSRRGPQPVKLPNLPPSPISCFFPLSGLPPGPHRPRASVQHHSLRTPCVRPGPLATVPGTSSAGPVHSLSHRPFFPARTPSPLSRRQSGLRFLVRKGKAKPKAPRPHASCICSFVSSIRTLAYVSL